ncbi:MAG: SGNH/GDSL hydrolase family protein [Ginsengibacter sp.]
MINFTFYGRTFYIISIILLILFGVSCWSENTISKTQLKPDTAMPGRSNTFLALGDSYTIGESVAAGENFPNQTVHILRAHHMRLSDPDIIATTGWTTNDLLNALKVTPPRHKYSYVSLLIGVNNQYQHKSISEYSNEFNSLLDSAIKYAGNIRQNVIVLSIPDYSLTPFAQKMDTAKIATELNAFNAVNKKLAGARGVCYLDITPISRGTKSNPGLTASDGLHPSALQYRKWAELLSAAILDSPVSPAAF